VSANRVELLHWWGKGIWGFQRQLKTRGLGVVGEKQRKTAQKEEGKQVCLSKKADHVFSKKKKGQNWGSFEKKI